MRFADLVGFAKKLASFWSEILVWKAFIPIVTGLILITGLSWGFLYQTTTARIANQRQEVDAWQWKVQTVENQPLNIPTFNDLPEVIEQCRVQLQTQGVNVDSFNVEKFRDEKQGVGLDYALLRLHMLGNPTTIQAGLNQIENLPGQAIHVREAVIKSTEGEVLLAIYLVAD